MTNLQVRKMRFAFADYDVPFLWNEENPAFSSMANAVSFLAIGFEKMIVNMIREITPRITDPEVIERRFPVRLLEFSIRHDSGGAGRKRGGDGICRELEFLAPVEVSLLSERRSRAPFGLCGGGPGAPGRNLLNGRELPARTTFQAVPGDRLRIETPGGGGYGKPG